MTATITASSAYKQHQRWTRYLGLLFSKHWLLIVTSASGITIGMAYLAPAIMMWGSPRLAKAIYTLYSLLCHQLPYRSWFISGAANFLSSESILGLNSIDSSTTVVHSTVREFTGNPTLGWKTALCQRHMAIFTGMFIAGILYSLLRARRFHITPVPWLHYLVIGIAPMAFDSVGHVLSLPPLSLPILMSHESTPLLRTSTGLLFGSMSVWLAYPYLDEWMVDVRQRYVQSYNQPRGKLGVMQVQQHEALTFTTFDSFPADRLTHAVFGRTGGVSPPPYESLNMSVGAGDRIENVRENHRRAFETLGLSLDAIATVHQVHGTRTVAVSTIPCDPTIQADAIITANLGVALFMSFADCVPIMLYDPVQHAIGIAHAGWKGTLGGIARIIVHEMGREYGCIPGDILAAIGPSISAENYPVGAEVARKIRFTFPDQEDLLTMRNGIAHFDLWAANKNILMKCGIKAIEISGLCTAANTAQFYSHRAEAGTTGRFGAMIALS